MSNAYERGWGNPGKPGSTQAAQYKSVNIRKYRVGGVDVWLHKDVAHLFIGFFTDLFNETGYNLSDGYADDWGYNNRNIRGYENCTSLDCKSNHSWGLALDGNAQHNPMTNSGPAITNMPVEVVRRLCAKWGLTWGHDYSGNRKDSMHFEFTGRPEDVHLYPRGGGSVADLIIYTDETGADALQILSDHGNLTGIPDGADLKDFYAAGAITIALRPSMFAMMKSKTTL